MAKQKKKAKKSSGIVLLVVLLLIGVVGFELVNVYGQIATAQEQERQLATQVQQQKEANASLQQDLARADDEEFIKELAREELGLTEPGERIFYDVNN